MARAVPTVCRPSVCSPFVHGHLNACTRNDIFGGHPVGYLLSYPTALPFGKDMRCAPDQKRGQIAVEPAAMMAASRDASAERGTWPRPRKSRLREPHTSGKFRRDLNGKTPPARTICAVPAPHYGFPCLPGG